jgi:hypothetical protein
MLVSIFSKNINSLSLKLVKQNFLLLNIAVLSLLTSCGGEETATVKKENLAPLTGNHQPITKSEILFRNYQNSEAQQLVTARNDFILPAPSSSLLSF